MSEKTQANHGPPDSREPIDRPLEMEAPEMSEQKPRAPQKRGLSPPGRFLVKLILVTALLTVMFTLVMGIHIQRGNRMYPFIMDGDLVITYKLEAYRVGDVVAYKNPDTGQAALSRIVAIGENEIEVTSYGALLINGVSPSESVFYPTYPIEDSAIEYPYTMRKGGYFVLDDYRTQGNDSRSFGQLIESELMGKVVYVFRRRGI